MKSFSEVQIVRSVRRASRGWMSGVLGEKRMSRAIRGCESGSRSEKYSSLGKSRMSLARGVPGEWRMSGMRGVPG